MYTLILINYGWLIKCHNVLGKHQNNYKLVFNIIKVKPIYITYVVIGCGCAEGFGAMLAADL